MVGVIFEVKRDRPKQAGLFDGFVLVKREQRGLRGVCVANIGIPMDRLGEVIRKLKSAEKKALEERGGSGW